MTEKDKLIEETTGWSTGATLDRIPLAVPVPQVNSSLVYGDSVDQNEGKPLERDPATEGNTDVEDEDRIKNERMIGAGVTAGAAALMCGPIVAAIVGYGTAYGTTKPGTAGDVCRAIGDTGLFIRDKAVELNTKHQIIEKTKEGAKGTIEKVRNPDTSKNIVDNTRNVFSNIWDNLREFENEHHLLGQTKTFLGEIFSSIIEKLRKNKDAEPKSNASKPIQGGTMI